MSFDIISSFKKLGLTSYDAKIYMSLLKFGSLTAYEISSASGVPYPKVYSSINKLKELKLVDVVNARPLKFKPAPPDESISELKNRIIEDLEKTSYFLIRELSPLYTAVSKMRRYGRVSIIGRIRIKRTISKILLKANQSLMISLPVYELIPKDALLKNLTKVSKKGVEIKLIVQNTEFEEMARKFRLQVKFTQMRLPLIVVVDKRIVMLCNRLRIEDGTEQWVCVMSLCNECAQNAIKVFQSVWENKPLKAEIKRTCLTDDEMHALIKYLKGWPSLKDLTRLT